jgi:ankyrin repeat protein
MRFLKKAARALNNNLNPYKAANDKKHAATEQLVRDMRQRKDTALAQLRKNYAAEKSRIESFLRQNEANKNKAVLEAKESLKKILEILELVPKAIEACIEDKNLENLEKLIDKINEYNGVGASDFNYYNPIGLAILFKSENALKMLLDKFSDHINPNAVVYSGETLLDYLQYCTDPDLTRNIVALINAKNAKATETLAIEFVSDVLDIDATTLLGLEGTFENLIKKDPVQQHEIKNVLNVFNLGLKALTRGQAVDTSGIQSLPEPENLAGDKAYYDKHKDKLDYTPLTYLIKRYQEAPDGSTEATNLFNAIVQVVVAGSDITLIDAKGNVPLFMLLQNNDLQLLAAVVSKAKLSSKNIPQIEAAMYEAQAKELHEVVEMIQYALFKAKHVPNSYDVHSYVNADGDTMLSVAVREDDGLLIGTILDLGADPDQLTANGASPLILAVAKGNLLAVKQLVAAGADIHLTCQYGSTRQKITALELAEKTQPLIFEYLLSSDTQQKKLLQNGFDVVHLEVLHPQTNESLATFAVLNNDQRLLEWLFESGYDFNTKNGNGESPLEIAVRLSNLDMLIKLLYNGAKFDDSLVAKAEAIASGTMLSVTATPLATTLDANGEILSNAVQIRDLLVAWHDSLINQEEAVLNAVNIATQETPLTAAIKASDIVRIRLLMFNGASLVKPNGNGETPLSLLRAATDSNIRILLAQSSLYKTTRQLQAEVGVYLPLTAAQDSVLSIALTPSFDMGDFTLYPKQHDDFQTEELEYAGFRLQHDTINNYIADQVVALVPQSSEVNSGFVVKELLAKNSRDAFWVNLENSKADLVLQFIYDPTTLQLLVDKKILRSNAVGNYVLRDYYPGVNMYDALVQLESRTETAVVSAAQCYMIANMFYRLSCIHQQGMSLRLAELDNFIWCTADGSCKFVGLQYLESFNVSNANDAISALCLQLLEENAPPNMLPAHVVELIEAMLLQPDYTKLAALAQRIQVAGFRMMKAQNETDVSRLVVASDLEAALAGAKDTRPLINLNKIIIKHYVSDPGLIVPATLDVSLRYLIMLLRQENIADIDIFLQEIEAVQIVHGKDYYSISPKDQRGLDLQGICLLISKNLPDSTEADKLRDIEDLMRLVQAHLNAIQDILPKSFTSLDPLQQFLFGFAHLYKVNIHMLQDSGNKDIIGDPSFKNTVCLKRYNGKYYLVSPIRNTLSPQTKRIVAKYYEHKTVIVAPEIVPDFRELRTIKSAENSLLWSIIFAINELENKPPAFVAALAGLTAKDLYNATIIKVAGMSTQELFDYCCNEYGVRVAIYSLHNTGSHSMLDVDKKYTTLALDAMHLPSGATVTPQIAIMQRDAKTVTPAGVTCIKHSYSALALNRQTQWLTPPDYQTAAPLAINNIYLVPKDKLGAHLETDTTFTIHLTVQYKGVLKYQGIKCIEVDGKDTVYVLDEDSSVCTKDYMASVALALGSHLQIPVIALQNDALSAQDVLKLYDRSISEPARHALNTVTIGGLGLVETAVVTNDNALLGKCIGLGLDLNKANEHGVLPIIQAVKSGYWDLVTTFIKSAINVGDYRGVLCIDAENGGSLTELLLAAKAAATKADDIAQIEKIYTAVSLLQALYFQNDHAEPTVLYAMVAKLGADKWVNSNVVAQYELRAQYYQLMIMPFGAKGLDFGVDEYTVLAEILGIRFDIEVDGALQSFGEGTYTRVSLSSTKLDKHQVLAECLKAIKSTKLAKTTPEILMQQVAAITSRSLVYADAAEQRQTREIIVKALQEAKEYKAKTDAKEWAQKCLPEEVERLKSTYEANINESVANLIAAHEEIQATLQQSLKDFSERYTALQAQAETDFKQELESGVTELNRSFKKAKKKLTKTLVIGAPLMMVTAGYLTPLMAGAFQIGKGTIQYAILRGALAAATSSIISGKFDPANFAKSFAISTAGFYAADSMQLLELKNQFAQAYAEAFAASLVTNVLSGEFKHALVNAIIDGAIQDLSMLVATPFTEASRLGSSMAAEVAQSFTVGVSSAVFHAITDKVVWGQDLDLSTAVIAGVQSVLIDLGRSKGIADAQTMSEREQREQAAAEAHRAAEEEARKRGLAQRQKEEDAKLKAGKERKSAVSKKEYERRKALKQLKSQSTPVQFKEIGAASVEAKQITFNQFIGNVEKDIGRPLTPAEKSEIQKAVRIEVSELMHPGFKSPIPVMTLKILNGTISMPGGKELILGMPKVGGGSSAQATPRFRLRNTLMRTATAMELGTKWLDTVAGEVTTTALTYRIPLDKGIASLAGIGLIGVFVCKKMMDEPYPSMAHTSPLNWIPVFTMPFNMLRGISYHEENDPLKTFSFTESTAKPLPKPSGYPAKTKPLPKPGGFPAEPPNFPTTTAHDSSVPDKSKYDTVPGKGAGFVGPKPHMFTPGYAAGKGSFDPLVFKKFSSPRRIVCANGLIYEDAPYHKEYDTAIKNKRPSNPKNGLENAIQVKDSSQTRISYDELSGEITIFMRHEYNVFHGHVRRWDELKQTHKNVLIENFGFSIKGKPPKYER